MVDWSAVIALASFILGAGVIVGSVLVGIVVARRRGLDQAEDRGDAALQRTLDAQDRRIELQDREIAELKSQVTKLQEQVASLTADLHASDAVVRRLSVASAKGAT